MINIIWELSHLIGPKTPGGCVEIVGKTSDTKVSGPISDDGVDMSIMETSFRDLYREIRSNEIIDAGWTSCGEEESQMSLHCEDRENP